jgi:hypothetical protein
MIADNNFAKMAESRAEKKQKLIDSFVAIRVPYFSKVFRGKMKKSVSRRLLLLGRHPSINCHPGAYNCQL